MWSRAAAFVVVLALAGCVSFAESLRRGIQHYDLERWNDAMGVWLEIEADLPNQTRSERGQYHAYRAFTHLRLGSRADARHHLALARQFLGAMPADVRRRVQEETRELEGGASP